MVVKYPVYTASQFEAISIAQNLAKSSGFKRSVTLSVKRIADTEWLITLDVQK